MFLRNGKTTDRLLKEAYELASVPNDRELDVLLSSGEQISISKLSILLNKLGYNSISLTGWQAGIYTNNTNQNAVIENIDISRIVKELGQRKIVIIAGFQGLNSALDITTLGRGGSDTTAVAVAAALKAKHCYIYSDVDGVYTTDPNKYSEAKKLSSLSYKEMLDIASEGAKVLHNRCVEIGEKFNIPIITKSTFNNKPGSIINDIIEDKIVKSIVKNDDLVLINLQNTSDSKDLFNIVYCTLINNNILPIQVMNNSIQISNITSENISSENTTSNSITNTLFDIDIMIKSTDLNKLKNLLKTEFNKFEFEIKEISRIAIVGYGITADNIIVKKIMNIISKFNFKIYNIDITNAKIIVTFTEKIDNNLLQLLHEELF